MDRDRQNPVLRTMAAGAQRAPGPPSALALLQRACERASDGLLRLPMQLGDAGMQKVAQEEIAALLPDSAMFVRLEGGAPGFVALGLPVARGIVEHRTIGKLLSGTAAERPPSRVDAALVSCFVDGALSRFSAALQAGPAVSWGQEARVFGAMVADARALLLSLPMSDYHLFSFQVTLADGARQGPLLFGFAEAPPQDTRATNTGQAHAQGVTLRAGVLAAPTTLDAVIARLALPLSQLQALRVGDCLPIPSNALGRCSLAARGGDHSLPVRLGQIDGMRAVRLVSAQSLPEAGGRAVAAKAGGDVIDAVPTPVSQGREKPPQKPATAEEPVETVVDGPEELDALLAAAEPVGGALVAT